MNALEILTFVADPEWCPARLDVLLTEQESAWSRSQVQKWIKAGKVRVNGEPCKARLLLQGGETVEVETPEQREWRLEPEAMALDILHEDEDLLVVNKPAGLVVHPGAGQPSGTLVNGLLAHTDRLSRAGGADRPGIVHRLDRLTSGCIAIARTDSAYRSLTAQLADHSMGRIYRAWVNGQVPEKSGTLEADIGRSSRNRTQMAVCRRGGRRAVTHWEVTHWAPGFTQLLCHLETGRTHQIRVHLAWLGHPVAGDPEYGLSYMDGKQKIPPGHPGIVQAYSRLKRQMLHAFQLNLSHPRTGEAMTFEAPVPEDMANFEQALIEKGSL